MIDVKMQSVKRSGMWLLKGICTYDRERIYMGVIIDGAEEWIKTINNSSKVKLEMPIFSSLEQTC